MAQGLSDFEAKVITARLGADGILWELRGVVDSVYPLGGIDVLVPLDELAAARASLRDTPETTADAHVHPAIPAGAVPAPYELNRPPGARRWWVFAVVVVGVTAFGASRVMGAVNSFQEPAADECSGSAQAAAEGTAVHCRR